MTKRAKIKPKQEEVIKNPYNNGIRQTKDIRLIKLDDTLTIKRNGVDVTNEWK